MSDIKEKMTDQGNGSTRIRHFDRRKAKYHGLIRAATVLTVLFLQVAFIAALAYWLQTDGLKIYFVVELLSIAIVFGLVNSEAYNQTFWIVILLVLPGFGFILYFFWGSFRKDFVVNSGLRKREAEALKRLPDNKEQLEELAQVHPNKIQISNYLSKEGFPVYRNTVQKYYPIGGEELANDFVDDLKKAKHSILMEFFIVYDGKWWREIEDVLVSKAAEGVDVRVLIDDFGSIFMDTVSMKKEMRRCGIKLESFKPINKRISSINFNYRNHQKIMVVDGTVGYTGGCNLADEYVNRIKRFGGSEWKDSMVRLEGEAVWTLTNIFLMMWEDSTGKEVEDPSVYKPRWKVEDQGFVQPFSGGPHKTPFNPVEGAYTRMISKARDYIYITTPYLVLDERLTGYLIDAAMSGVDVRILTPRIYDKWYVYMVTVSNYGKLLRNGVRIFEYIPGFIHEKDVVADDECAICGTINLDFRSMHTHHENGVFFSRTPIVDEIRDNILKSFSKSEEVTYEEWKKRPTAEKIMQWFFKLTSPLL